MSARSDFLAGARNVASLLPPVFTVGVVAGVAAADAGFTGLQTVGMGLLFFSPVSTVTTIGLLDAGAPAIVVLITALSVVIHFSVLSLSIAPYFDRFSTAWKWILAYFLNTPNYALSIDRYEADPEADVRWVYLGVAVPMWIAWQAAIVGGVAFGVRVPQGTGIDFVIPLVFVALLVNAVQNRVGVAVAVVGGVVSVVGVGLPLNAGLVVAMVAGTAAGVLLQARGWGG